MERRNFLQLSAAAALPQAARTKKMIGIQVGAISFLDEGSEKVLDILQERASVNTLFLAVFTYGRGIAGRQVPGQPLPDHGKQEYDLNFHGGNYATPHPEFYRNTVLKDTKAPDHGNYDLLADVIPRAKKRGMKSICWLEDVFRADTPNIAKLQEKDFNGRPRTTLCFNNPEYHNFLVGLVADYTSSYDVDGIMWGSERQGALANALGASHGGRGSDAGKVGCFCEFCEKKGRARGIDFDRVREGYRALEQFVKAARNGNRPVDGHFVTFWRIAMRYPEILAWEQLWHDSLRETYASIHATVHGVKKDVPVGWHIWHNNSFNPLYRAQQDIKELAKCSDFLKMVMYHNCGGERMASYVDSVAGDIFGDVPREQLLEFNYRVMNYGKEAGLADVAARGLSADYVYREAKRAVDAAQGTNTLIWPGIDIDIPTGAKSSKSTPEGTQAAVLAALRAGAHGVLLSRKYSEMRLANLSGAGAAVKESGIA